MDNFLTDRDVFKLIEAIKANNEKMKALANDNEWKLESIRIRLQSSEKLRDLCMGGNGMVPAGPGTLAG
jgi:N12 class adenine-specific DNA methylase